MGKATVEQQVGFGRWIVALVLAGEELTLICVCGATTHDNPREPEHQKQTEHQLILGESHARSLPQDSTPEIDGSSNTQDDAVHGREVL